MWQLSENDMDTVDLALERVLEYFDKRADAVYGEDGLEPNEAMHLFSECSTALIALNRAIKRIG
tara:strand:- start:560 stop:751 length:192 start_codon:yes stop_codon:yes gene_type:complete